MISKRERHTPLFFVNYSIMSITIWDYTVRDPLNMIGMAAGICYGSDVSDPEKNKKRAIDCIEANHGRVMEWPDVYCTVDEYSARCLREAMRHIVGTSTLQASTRYIKYDNFDLVSNVNNEAHQKLFDECRDYLREAYNNLIEAGVSKEDAANVLPLGMTSKMVWKINLRALIHFMSKRKCTRAYKEIRKMCKDICTELSNYSEDWKYIVDNYFLIDCERLGYCPEAKSCGYIPKKGEKA
jgi:thymidylate synthase (FAD)